MKRFGWMIGLGLMLIGGCGYNAIGECESRCQEQVDRGCRTGSSDCESACANAQVEYDRSAAAADNAGCSAEFDTFVDCSTSGDACDGADCTVTLMGLGQCIADYCAANPSDPEC